MTPTGNRRRIRGRGNVIAARGAILRKVRIDIEGNGNAVTIGRGTRLNRVLIRIRGDRHVVRIGAGCRFHERGTIWMEGDGGMIEIGDGTTAVSADLACTEMRSRITLGRDCMLAFAVDIRCGDSHSILDRETGRRINPAADVQIGDHVWIGPYAVVLKGVTIGTHAVVAIRSVVTADVPSHVIVAGAPARVIRENVTWDRRRL